MIRYECDRCGAKLRANDPGRFIVKMEIFAAAGHLDVSEDDVEKASESMEEVLRELVDADPDEIEDQTYRAFRFDLCDACRRVMISRPLGESE